jgi:hypothetical protein
MTETQELKRIKPGTPEMEALLQAGYPDMSVDKAKRIIKERQERPELWPYAMLERAEAFLAAYNAKPIAVSTRVPERKLHKNE